MYEVIIWYDTAAQPDHTQRQTSHTEKERVDTKEQAKEFIKDELWQVDNIENSGHRIDHRKEYGYWSKTKDRQTGKQWYIWATVEVRKLEVEIIDTNEVV